MMLAANVAHEDKKRSREQSRYENEELRRDISYSPGLERHSKIRRENEESTPISSDGPRNIVSHSHFQKGNAFTPTMGTNPPSPHPKHVIIPSPPNSIERSEMSRHRHHSSDPYVDSPDGDRGRPMRHHPSEFFVESPPDSKHSPEKIDTPVLAHEARSVHHGYDGPGYRPSSSGYHYPNDGYNNYNGPPPDMQYGHGPPPPMGPNVMNSRSRRWSCDFCYASNFHSYEEACAHEHACGARFDAYCRETGYNGPPPPPPPPPPQHYNNNQGGLGTLYHASQELQHYGNPMPPPPPPPHQHHHEYNGYHSNGWHQPPPYGPPPHRLPPHRSPHMPTDRPGYSNLAPRFHDHRVHSRREHPHSNHNRILLAMPTDTDSLSDRQCYVRSEFVEVFAATDKDVAARHSKGAQKLAMGQVGIRCMHCTHLRPKDRAERAVCYPSSISRIYQTVADMQRFHFEHCREIPENIRRIYKSLKTTRPRGVGSPQTYWIQSAKLMNLIDSEEGIRFRKEGEDENGIPNKDAK